MVLMLVLGLIVLRLAAELVLAALNRAEVRRHAAAPPAAAAAIMDSETYGKSVAYTLAKNRFGMLEMIFDAGLLALVLISGFLPWLYGEIAFVGGPGAAWDDALFILATLLVLGAASLPFEWMAQFRLEARFGFNKSTPGLWISDKLKGVLLLFLLGFPIFWGLISLVGWVGRAWWIWAFVLLFALQLLMIVLYPKLILPLFNKLTPLSDGELRNRLLALADRTGFRARTIEVIDGSKRSAHSNAYFTGFGRFRRIVLFDTLVSQLTPVELEAVLAHEVGHYKRGHIPQRLALGAALQFGMLAALDWLVRSEGFNPAFGFPPGELAPAFLLFGLLGGLITSWFSPLGNLLSRRHEYEADAFARDAMGRPEPLVDALRKLAQKNLSNLTPHPWFSRVYYSHPTLTEREQALAAR